MFLKSIFIFDVKNTSLSVKPFNILLVLFDY